MFVPRPTRRLDIAGSRFGSLVAIQSTGERRRGVGSYVWQCSCDCGETYFVSVDKLRSGNTRRCLKCSQQRLPPGLSLYRDVIKQYRANARTRRIEWSLPEEDAIALMKRPCAYCGKKADEEPLATKRYKDITVHYNGIDRVDNDLDYDIANCVSCCAQCNWAKSNMTFAAWCGWVARLKANFAGIKDRVEG